MHPIPSVSPPWSTAGKRLESSIRKALHDFQMFEGVSKLAIALSGGKDSLTLLFMLKAILGYGFPKLPLVAINVNGEFSCGAGMQSDYLQGICEQLEIPLVVKESHQKLETLSCYPCSRERRKLLFDAAKEFGAEAIVFGHHRDDNAQTLLMNLLQKGEFAGTLPKLPMHHYGITILRPMIYISEEEIRTFAQQQGFLRITCRCPVGQNSMRRKVDQLLTEMEEFFPHTRNNLSLAALLYGSQKAALEP